MWRPSRSSPWRSSSTSEAGRAAAALLVAALVGFAAAVVGCSAYEAFHPEPQSKADLSQAKAPPAPPRIAFDHKFHLGAGVGCADCHEGTEKADKAPMPTVEFCMNCHEDIDAKKPKEKQVAAFVDAKGKPQWSAVTAQSPDIVFSHKTHLVKKLECAACHAGIATSTVVTKDLFTDMDSCMSCHAKSGAKNECSTCHREAQASVAAGKGQFWMPENHHGKTWPAGHGAVGMQAKPAVRAEQCDLCHGVEGGPSTCAQCHVATRPANHDRIWQTLHGQTVRADPDVLTGKCAFCHNATGFPNDSKCASCHATQPPRDHTQSWRVDAGHGLAAALDRERCEACHRTDTCVACHDSMQPRSHRGRFGSPRNTHCAGCHLPLTAGEQGGCGTCHKATPSHAAAPRMPAEPPHRPDLQCRQCHDRPPNLRHFDNGTNCLQCHR